MQYFLEYDHFVKSKTFEAKRTKVRQLHVDPIISMLAIQAAPANTTATFFSSTFRRKLNSIHSVKLGIHQWRILDIFKATLLQNCFGPATWSYSLKIRWACASHLDIPTKVLQFSARKLVTTLVSSFCEPIHSSRMNALAHQVFEQSF